MGLGIFIVGRILNKRPKKPPQYYETAADQMNELVNNGLNKLGVSEFLNNQSEKNKIKNSRSGFIVHFFTLLILGAVIFLLFSYLTQTPV